MCHEMYMESDKIQYMISFAVYFEVKNEQNHDFKLFKDVLHSINGI